MRMWRHSRPRDEGASAVEFALVLPLLVTLLLGIIQFGIIFFQWLEIEHAAREGVRWTSLRDAGGYATVGAATRAAAKAAAPGVALTDADITVSPEDPTEEDFGDPATVTVRYDAPLIAPWVQHLLGVSGAVFPLEAAATQRIE